MNRRTERAIRKSIIQQLEELQEHGDTEHAHAEADNLLYEFLIRLGYSDVAYAYEEIDKWYA